MEKEEEVELSLANDNPLHLAKRALELDDPETALRLFNEVSARYPNYVKRSHHTLAILLGLKLYDLAESMLRETMNMFPNDAHYAQGYALVAEHSGRHAEALERWSMVRKRFPLSWVTFVNPARILRTIGRLDEAEKLLRVAVQRFPDSLQAGIEYAWVAEDRADWKEARVRWEQLSNRQEHAVAILGQARAIAVQQDLEQAEAYLLSMRTKFGYERDIAVECARLAEKREDLEAAARHWEHVRRWFPQYAPGHHNCIRLLAALGLNAEAHAVLDRAKVLFPSEKWAVSAEAEGNPPTP